MELINYVRELRVLRGVSQKELAEAIGCSAQHILDIEKRRQQPTIVFCLKMAEFFEITVEQIFKLKK